MGDKKNRTYARKRSKRAKSAKKRLDETKRKSVKQDHVFEAGFSGKCIPNRFCSAKNCFNSRVTSRDLSFFSYPKNEHRCKVWLERAGRIDLSTKRPAALRRSKFLLCAEHFEKDQFSSSFKNCLIASALPTIFPTSPSGSSMQLYKKEIPKKLKAKIAPNSLENSPTRHPFKCEPCRMGFADASELAIHTKTHQTGAVCYGTSQGHDGSTVRDSSLRQISLLKTASDEHRDGESSAKSVPIATSKKKSVYTCVICRLTFSEMDKLAAHARSHSSKDSEFQHFLTYTGEMVFSCKVCRKIYPETPERCTHNELTIPCRFCEMVFQKKLDRDLHELIHEKKYIRNPRIFRKAKRKLDSETICGSKSNFLDETSQQEKQDDLGFRTQHVNVISTEPLETYILPTLLPDEPIFDQNSCETKLGTHILPISQKNLSCNEHTDQSGSFEKKLPQDGMIQIKTEPPDYYYSTCISEDAVQVKLEENCNSSLFVNETASSVMKEECTTN